MKRRVKAPDGREWVVQFVWWPRPGAFRATGDVGLTGGGVVLLLGMVVDAIHVLLWPLVFAFRVVFRRPWLIEAFRSDNHAQGAAWHVHSLNAGESAVEVNRNRNRSRKP